MEYRIEPEHIEEILEFKLSERLKNIIKNFDLRYEVVENLFRQEKYLVDVINVLTSDIEFSGKHRLSSWESGWEQNLEEFNSSGDYSKLIPKYHGKKKYVRWKKQIIKPLVDFFDYKIHICILDAIIEKWIGDTKHFYEFGCGPAYHLLRTSNVFPEISYYGLDWTENSQKIIRSINEKFDKNITGKRFDFFNPDDEVEINSNSLVVTVAALEQTGENYKKFVEFLLKKKPSLCINIEPMSEFLEKDNLLDLLSIKYFEKRKYLKGYYDYLLQLEKEGRIEILDSRRTFAGSYFIDGHSLVVWRVL
jgi:hypothetical protein